MIRIVLTCDHCSTESFMFSHGHPTTPDLREAARARGWSVQLSNGHAIDVCPQCKDLWETPGETRVQTAAVS